MIKQLQLILAILTIVITACSNDHGPQIERPGEKPAVEAALLDSCMRIEASSLTLRYDDGGILFSKDDDGIISAIRLTDDARISFDPSKPAIDINGISITITDAEIAKQDGSTLWYSITTSDPKDNKIYIVINF